MCQEHVRLPRRFPTALLLLCALLYRGSIFTAEPALCAGNERPNVLFIAMDDLRTELGLLRRLDGQDTEY